jgi:hypothetical protein
MWLTTTNSTTSLHPQEKNLRNFAELTMSSKNHASHKLDYETEILHLMRQVEGEMRSGRPHLFALRNEVSSL